MKKDRLLTVLNRHGEVVAEGIFKLKKVKMSKKATNWILDILEYEPTLNIYADGKLRMVILDAELVFRGDKSPLPERDKFGRKLQRFEVGGFVRTAQKDFLPPCGRY